MKSFLETIESSSQKIGELPKAELKREMLHSVTLVDLLNQVKK
jgi:hypothetical protein